MPALMPPAAGCPEHSNYGLSPSTCSALARDTRRIVITGAGGWLGRATLDLLLRCLGPADATERVHCFGSTARMIEIGSETRFFQKPVEFIRELPTCPTLMLHLAFVTKDKAAGMSVEDYVRANQCLSRLIMDSLDTIGTDRLFVASSGAAAFINDPDSPVDLRIYGRLKRDDEIRFADWANSGANRCAVITRIFSLSGPFINKHHNYALASFILDALHDRPITIRSRTPVTRSYVAIRELMSLVFSALLSEKEPPVLEFDSGGEPKEIGELARSIAQLFGPVPTQREAASDGRHDTYAGDDAMYQALLSKFAIEPIGLPTQIIETAAFLARQLDS